MNETTLNAVLLVIGAVTVVWALLAGAFLLGVLTLMFLFTVSLLYRLLDAVERLADNVDRLEAASTDGGRPGPGRGTDDRRSGEANRDDGERPPAAERSPDEPFE